MGKYIWSPSVYQLGVTGNAAAANSVVTMYSNAANIITNQIPYFFTRNSGLGGNITGLLANASFTFDGANFIVANTTANTNVIITTNGDYFGTGNLSIAGNISGNGAGLTGVSAGGLANGTSNISIPTSSGNIIAGIAGTANIITWAPTGEYVTGEVSATGNITSNSYFVGNGAFLTGISSSSNSIINGGSSVLIPTTGGNINMNVAGSGNIVTIAVDGQSVTGNVTASGNIQGNYILGNGSQLTGITVGASTLANGTSNVNIPSTSGNVITSVAGTPNVVVVDASGQYVTGDTSVSGNITANANISGSYIFGNGALLTGIAVSSTSISNGLSNCLLYTSDAADE